MSRKIDVVERDEVPWLSVLLGYGPMMPILAGAVAAWTLPGTWRTEAVIMTTVYAASILGFLAGVRRGLSFRTEGGPALLQIATMFVLFMLALGAQVLIVHGVAFSAVLMVLIGFLATAVLDPIAARAGQAPIFFARLRPPQMSIGVVALGVLLFVVWSTGGL